MESEERYECDFLEISDDEASKLLEHIVSHHEENNRVRFLEYSVDGSDGDDLVKGDESTTWLSLSNEREEKLCYYLKDDEGVFELEHFDIAPDGLFECLECLYYQQNEVSQEVFVKNIQELFMKL